MNSRPAVKGDPCHVDNGALSATDMVGATPASVDRIRPNQISEGRERRAPYDPSPMATTLASEFLLDLEWRGLLHTASEGADEHLATGRRRAYVGYDATADSLTIGNLCTVMLLVHLAAAGHEPVVVLGGGTSLVGDPSGRSSERPLLDVAQIEANVAAIAASLERLLPGAEFVNNLDWLGSIGYLEMLRDTGKYFSVNEMIRRDSVRDRLEGREQGISYTEFSYMLLQAYDFEHLHRTRNVTVQMGGSDQFGNIVSGGELIRRKSGGQGFAVTCPLLMKSDGEKFGKSHSGAVWLSAQRTSPYQFHQFWLNSDDADVDRFLRIFTLLPREEIEELVRSSGADPGARVAQRALADRATDLVHGAAARERATHAATALFSGDVAGLDAETLRDVVAEVPSSRRGPAPLEGIDILDLLTETGLASSRRQGREFLENGSISVNGAKVAPDHRVMPDDLLDGDTALLRRGRKQWHAVTFGLLAGST
jgi:tyrosyl-tRNA synthetase